MMQLNCCASPESKPVLGSFLKPNRRGMSSPDLRAPSKKTPRNRAEARYMNGLRQSLTERARWAHISRASQMSGFVQSNPRASTYPFTLQGHDL
jgi:hypothetical protein